jgi:hypothetical protein
MLGWDRYRFNKRRTETCYAELLFLHLVGSAGQVVHFGVSEAQNVDVLFFMSEWTRCGFHRKHTGTLYAGLVFLHPVRSMVHIVHSGASGA